MSIMPITPYSESGGESTTSGWSGSEASHDRAKTEDANGTTSMRQTKTLGLVQAMGREGLTVVDLRDLTDWHHGQASGALSVLHKEGLIARLKDRRDRCHIYVDPQFVEGRATAPHGRAKPKPPTLTDEEEGALRTAKKNLSNGWMTDRVTVAVLTSVVERLVRNG